MPYDLVFDNVEAVPEGLRYEGLKAGEDGKVKISVVPKTRLDEFRQNNITVSQERDTFKSRAEELAAIVGDDPKAFKEEFESLRSIKQKVDDGTLKVSDEIEKVVNERVAAMKENYESLLAEERKGKTTEKQRADAAEQAIRDGRVERLITDACLRPDSGVRPEAIAEFIADAKTVWTFPKDGGEPKPMRKGSVIYGENGTDPMTPEEWVASLKKSKGYRFKDSGGGGALGGDRATSFEGMSAEQFAALPAKQRLAAINRAQAGGAKRR